MPLFKVERHPPFKQWQRLDYRSILCHVKCGPVVQAIALQKLARRLLLEDLLLAPWSGFFVEHYLNPAQLYEATYFCTATSTDEEKTHPKEQADEMCSMEEVASVYFSFPP